ncbi:MAG: GTPase Era [Coriobacteriales bacterium]|jgi:GTP-binding protein Era|nr:GTPase Era [Coriobacteriales bacterium]
MTGQDASVDFQSGFVTLAGRPNVGKSTLLNAALGHKVAITSNVAQTTRHRFRAILNGQGFQMVFVDTPGLHKPHDALGEELNHSAIQGMTDVDVVAFCLDATQQFGRGDEWVLSQIEQTTSARLLVVTKSLLAGTEQVASQMSAAQKCLDFSAALAVSALEGYQVSSFVEICKNLLPPGPAWFDPDKDTDQPLEVIIAEFIREKVLHATFDELPHAIGVQVEEMERDEKAKLYRISAAIYVERESQKGMVVGKGGRMIKEIGSSARQDLEHLLACRVYLDLRVKLRKQWRRDANQIRRFGYGQ